MIARPEAGACTDTITVDRSSTTPSIGQERHSWPTPTSSTPAAHPAASASRARARSPTSTRSTSAAPCSRRSRPQRLRHRETSTTSSGEPARRCASRAATSAACRRSTPATTSRRAASRSIASADRASPRANIAAMSVMAGMEDLVVSGGTEMMSLPKKGLLPMGANNPHLQDLHPQSHQGVCADAIATLEGIPREALDAHAAESQAPSRRRDQGGPLRQEPDPGAQPRRFARARPRGVPATGHHRRVAGEAGSSRASPAVADYRHDEDSLTFREQINGPLVPRSRDRARPPRRQLVGCRRRLRRDPDGRARTTPRPTGSPRGLASSRSRPRATTRR